MGSKKRVIEAHRHRNPTKIDKKTDATMTGAKARECLPYLRITDRLQYPSRPMNSHHNAAMVMPCVPTANAIASVALTSPSPSAPGFIKASRYCTRALITDITIAMITIDHDADMNPHETRTPSCVQYPTTIQILGIVLDVMSCTLIARPNMRLGSKARYGIT